MKLRPGLLVALVLALVVVGYLGALDVGFVWDDRVVALDVSGHERTFVQAFTQPFWQENAISSTTAPYFRPLSSASFLLDQKLHGANPAGFHLTNLALHLVACGLLFGVARKFRISPIASAIGSFVFGVAPVLCECVTWISGRTDVLATVFAFGGVLAWPADEKSSLGRRVLASVLFMFAFAAKETAIVVPIALITSGVARTNVQTHLRKAAPIALALAVTLAFRAYVLRGTASYVTAFSYRDRAIASLEAIGHYVIALVAPWHSQLQMGLIGAPDFTWIAAGALFFLAFVVGLVLAARRTAFTNAERFGLLVALGAIILVLPLGPVRLSVVAADRFLYLPFAGLVIAVGSASYRLSTKAQRIVGGVFVASGALSLALLPGVNALWADELQLWLTACETASPANSAPLTALGNVLYRGRAYQRALGVYNFAIGKTYGDTRVQALQNVANARAKLGQYDEAEKIRAAQLEQDPDAPRLLRDLALSRLQHFDFATARALGARTRDADLLHSIDDAEGFATAPSRVRSALSAEALARYDAETQSATDRRPEAMAAWTRVLALPDATLVDRERAAAYLVKDADPALAKDGVAALRSAAPEAPVLPDLDLELTRRETFSAEVARESNRLARFSSN